MLTLFWIIVTLAVACAIASWIVGAVYFARTLHALAGEPGERRSLWLAIVAWPFAVARLKGGTAEHAAKVNKALVAFIACLMVAVTATSVATNLSRIAR